MPVLQFQQRGFRTQFFLKIKITYFANVFSTSN